MRTLLGALLALLIPIIGYTQEKPQDILKKAEKKSVSIYLREWGKLSQFCSGGIIYADSNIVRVLTAGHCIAIPQKEAKTIQFAISRDGLNFIKAEVLASGWKPKETPNYTFPFSLKAIMPSLEQAGDYNDVADTSGGDWAVLEYKNVFGEEPANLIGDSSKLELGDNVYSVGYPAAGDKVASSGMISNLHYYAPQIAWDGYLAANISAAPGSSGSTVYDSSGKVIGIIVAGLNGTLLHFLTPINLVKEKISCINK